VEGEAGLPSSHRNGDADCARGFPPHEPKRFADANSKDACETALGSAFAAPITKPKQASATGGSKTGYLQEDCCRFDNEVVLSGQLLNLREEVRRLTRQSGR
jgi:hypothetical protein